MALAAGTLTLADALALADACLQRNSFSLAVDPLRLDLPPLSAESAPTAAGLRAMSALYVQAELEQAGVIPVAELLAREWPTLDVTSPEAAALLDAFASGVRDDWLSRDDRDRLFARVFGIGRHSADGGGAAVNRDFENRLATLCLALVRHADGYRWGALPGAAREAGLRQAALALLGNLAPRESGNTVLAGRRIQAELRRAIELLGHPGLTSLFGGRGLWDTLRRVLGPDAPDFTRLVDRGQSGQRLLGWLATVLPRLVHETNGGPLLDADAAEYRHAAVWLQASGVAVREPGLERVA
jgi:hypothetical protein